MADATVAPYGAWRSPFTAADIAAGSVTLGQVQVDGDDVYWLEGRASEGGRYALMRRAAGGDVEEITPPGENVRTLAHEYGGGSYVVQSSIVFYSRFVDQRLYRLERGAEPRPITPEPDQPRGLRYADARVSADGRWLVCVRESHPAEGEAASEVVLLSSEGTVPPRVLASGRDFYAAPRLSPDGRRVAWLQWDHPNMPWDGTQLWVADFDPEEGVFAARPVAGGTEESIFQPEWGPDGALFYATDGPTGWWNLHRQREGEPAEPLNDVYVEAEFGRPQWVFGSSTYAFLSDGRVVAATIKHGFESLVLFSPTGKPYETLDIPYAAFGSSLRSDGGDRVAFVASSPRHPSAVVVLEVSSGQVEVVRRSLEREIDPAYISVPRPIEYPTTDGQSAHALYYPPRNAAFTGPPGERPPLLVEIHGGPTSMAAASFSLDIQYWTSRGIAVVDVNYGGSTGYGRAYRDRLKGQWGIVDVADCVNAARYLAEQGEVDGRRMAIRGGSAGGYTTLAALTFYPGVFAAGASYFGVADLELLAQDTHKFESRYLDSLVGPYPERADLYRERSPIHAADRLSCPVILFQGLEDKVVPPSQAETMVAALRAKGLPYAYLAFEGEQHGFRRAETIQRTLEAELYFYGRVFGFQPADEIEPVEIQNL